MHFYYIFGIGEFHFVPFADIHVFVKDKCSIALVTRVFSVCSNDEVRRGYLDSVRPFFLFKFFRKEKREKKKAVLTAEKTNGNGALRS